MRRAAQAINKKNHNLVVISNRQGRIEFMKLHPVVLFRDGLMCAPRCLNFSRIDCPNRKIERRQALAGHPCLMALPKNKTKIVATIGPASETPEVLERLIR